MSRLEHLYRFRYMFGEGQIGLTGSQGTHINPFVVDCIHPDAIAQKGSTRFSF